MPFKIILADPSPSIQKNIQIAFPEPEFRLFLFENGEALLEAVSEIGPDAFLLSLSLPVRDGYEVARLLRARTEYRRTPLFFLKGTFEAFDEERIDMTGFDGIVTKPFDSEKLASEVRAIIEKRAGPSSLPEDPVWESTKELQKNGDGEARRTAADRTPPTEAPGPESVSPRSSASPDTRSASESQVREWVREEIYELERELEKRIRARILLQKKGEETEE